MWYVFVYYRFFLYFFAKLLLFICLPFLKFIIYFVRINALISLLEGSLSCQFYEFLHCQNIFILSYMNFSSSQF